MNKEINPRSNRRLRKRQKRFKVFLIIFLVLLLIAGFFWMFFFTPVLAIKNISLSGIKDISQEEITSRIDNYLEVQSLKLFPGFVVNFMKTKGYLKSMFDNLNKKNFVLLSRSGLVKELTKAYPELRQVKINFSLSSKTLSVDASGREISLIWCNSDDTKCAYLDQQGIAFEMAPEISGFLTIKVSDMNNEEISLGKEIMTENSVLFVEQTQGLLKGQNIEIAKIEVNGLKPSSFKFYTQKGWYLLTSSSIGPNKIIEVMKILLEKEIKDNADNLEYIDLRYPERAIYKLK